MNDHPSIRSSRPRDRLSMNELVCVRVSVYRNALTRGKRYTVLDSDDAKRQVRVKGDNGRTRWFPAYCFNQSDRPVPTLTGYRLDDPITLAQEHPIEVTVELSNGDQRWCIFATPSVLANCGDWINGTQVPFHYGNRHVIIAGELSEDLIGRMLQHIDNQGCLVECTLPLPDGDTDIA